MYKTNQVHSSSTCHLAADNELVYIFCPVQLCPNLLQVSADTGLVVMFLPLLSLNCLLRRPYDESQADLRLRHPGSVLWFTHLPCSVNLMLLHCTIHHWVPTEDCGLNSKG